MATSKYDKMFSAEEKENIIKDYVENGLSVSRIRDKYSIRNKEWIRKLIGNKMRATSGAVKMAHMLYPERFKHTEESKRKISEIRLKYMKEHPEDTVWRKRNEPSYPEKCFIKFLEDNGYAQKYYIEREYSIFPYYIDFAFVDQKIAVEIDGSQHILDEKRKERDKKKDALLNSLKWSVIRFTENTAKKDWHTMKYVLDETLKRHPLITTRVGIFKHEAKAHKKVQRDKNGPSEKQIASAIKQRKIKIRPTKEEITRRLCSSSFEALSREYGVSSNAIRKWCRAYGMPYHIKEIRDMACSYNG